MAVEFKKFAAEWKALESKFDTVWQELDSAAQTEKNTKDLLEGAREDLVEKVFDAKRGGTLGKALADFIGDAEVKKAVAGLQPMFKVLERAHQEYEGGKTKFKTLHDDAKKLKGRVDEEVKSRKKKIFEPKSLPDLEKLSKAIDARLADMSRKHMRSIQDFAKEKPTAFTFDKTTLKRIDTDIASGVNSIKVDADDSTVLREFAIRHLAVINSKVIDLSKAATGFCVAALKARKASDEPGAKKEFDKALKLADEAQGISEKYAKALKEKGGEIAAHKDGKKMLAGVNKINATVRGVLDLVAKTQKAMG